MISIAKKAPKQKFDLSDHEVEVLQCLADGQIISGISHELGLSPNTVKFHLGRIYKKLDIRTQAGAVAKGIRNGVI